jgi:hypothetical protein
MLSFFNGSLYPLSIESETPRVGIQNLKLAKVDESGKRKQAMISLHSNGLQNNITLRFKITDMGRPRVDDLDK